uniref:Hexosyltransferase n=1 Tax=Phallusia mammillata TaxID=59560 RepID=A0A6F9DGV1_9ASCI|nr:uncharacterized protein LOC100181857 [Phallusia mammillata]
MRFTGKILKLLVGIGLVNYTIFVIFWQLKGTMNLNTRVARNQNNTALWKSNTSSTTLLTTTTTTTTLSTTTESVKDSKSYMNNVTTKRPEATYIIEPRDIVEPYQMSDYNFKCQNYKREKVFEPSWTMVIFVKSKASNFDRRKVIRSTWGKYKVVGSVRLEKVFVLGKVEETEIQTKIKLENETNGDMLQYTGPDDYRNMPLKISSAMQWAAHNLPPEFIYASTDDDFLLNFASALKLIQQRIETRQQTKKLNLTETLKSLPIYCLYYKGDKTKPERNKGNKYYISEKEYSTETYPPYCGGGFYTISVEMLRELHNLSRVTITLPMDDVWVTGLLRQKLGRGDDNIEIIQPPKPVPKNKIIWKHFWGDYGKKQKNIPKMLYDSWRAWEPEIASKPFCIR